MLFESQTNSFSLDIIGRRAHSIDFYLTFSEFLIDVDSLNVLTDRYDTLLAHACNCGGEKTFGQVIASGSVDLGHVLEHLTIDLLVRAYRRVYGSQEIPIFAGTTSLVEDRHDTQRITISYVFGQAILVYEAMRRACHVIDEVLSGESLSQPQEVIGPLVMLLNDKTVCRR